MFSVEELKDRLKAVPESDGSCRADCPVCMQEGGNGRGGLKIYSNGCFGCSRYASSSNVERREHKRAILKEVGLEGNGHPAAISATLLNDRITIEVSPPSRGKHRIVARDNESDQVLAMDVIVLAESRGREQFLTVFNDSNPDEFNNDELKEVRKTLVALADRTTRVEAAVELKQDKEPAKEVSFVALEDGRVAEQIVRDGCASFAIYDPALGSTSFAERIEEEEDRVYRPATDELLLTDRGIYMPTSVVEYGDDTMLFAGIVDYLRKYIDLAESSLKLTAIYILLTYLADKLLEVPYLRAVGERGNGKSRYILAVGLACYRPLITISPTAAALFRLQDKFHATLIIDEANFNEKSDDTNAVIQILNSGFQQVGKIPRCEPRADGQFDVKVFDPFGPKIIASLKQTESGAFESRAIRILMQRTDRNDIPLRLTPRMLKDAEVLRNRLTLWRLRHWRNDLEPALDLAENELKLHGIEPRYIQIGTPLYALLTDPDMKDDFVAMLKARHEADAGDRQQSFDGQIIRAMYDLLFSITELDEVVWRNEKTVAAPVGGEPCEYLLVEEIAATMNVEREQNRAPKLVDARWIGKQIRRLELTTKEILRRQSAFRRKSAVVFDRRRLGKLFEIYSLPLPHDFYSTDPADPGNSPRSSHSSRSGSGDSASEPRGPEQASDNRECRTDRRSKEWSDQETETADHSKPLNNGNLRNAVGAVGSFPGSIGTEEVVTNSFVALDCETEPFNAKTGITPRTARMIGLAKAEDAEKAEYVTDPNAWQLMMPGSDRKVIFHNSQFDRAVLHRSGLPVPMDFEDTLIAARLLNENVPNGLKPLARKHLGVIPVTFDEASRKGVLDPEVFNEYARNDALYTLRLWPIFLEELTRQGLMRVYDLEKGLLPVVLSMEEIGMKIDLPLLNVLSREISTESEKLREEIYRFAGCEFDLNSPRNVAVILYDKLGLKCAKRTKNGQRSTDKNSLKALCGYHPIAVPLLKFREIDKLAKSFMKTLPQFADAGGRIHPEFKSLGARTGRFSCKQPNVQQIPARSELGKKLRSAFIAEPGNKLVVADYGQMELRVLAHYTQDPSLLAAYRNGVDLHTLTASQVFGKKESEVTKAERSIAKTINFGVAYGITPRGLFNQLSSAGIEANESQCEKFIRDYFKTYKGVRRWLDSTERTARTQGYVTNLFGRRRRLVGRDSRAARQACNFPIQGTAADICKEAMVKVHESLPSGAHIIAQVHDELIIECRAEDADSVCAMVKEIMERAPEGFTVPLEVDAKVVDNWSEAK